MFHQICHKWFTPHVDLFATQLNHNLPWYVSPVPYPKAWDIDALNIKCTGLTTYAYPPMALLHRVIQKPGKKSLPNHRNNPRLARDTLALGPSAALNRDPTSSSSVKTLQSHNYVFHSYPQHLNLQAWCLGVNSSKNKASLWRWQKSVAEVKWALFEIWCRENQGRSPLLL